MKIQVSWDDNIPQLLRWQFAKSWTWAEYHEAVQYTNELIKQHAEAVDIIVDMRAARIWPSGVLQEVSEAFITRPSNLRYSIVYGTPIGLRSLYNVFERLHKCVQPDCPLHLMFVYNEAEALAALAQKRKTARWLQGADTRPKFAGHVKIR